MKLWGLTFLHVQRVMVSRKEVECRRCWHHESIGEMRMLRTDFENEVKMENPHV